MAEEPSLLIEQASVPCNGTLSLSGDGILSGLRVEAEREALAETCEGDGEVDEVVAF